MSLCPVQTPSSLPTPTPHSSCSMPTSTCVRLTGSLLPTAGPICKEPAEVESAPLMCSDFSSVSGDSSQQPHSDDEVAIWREPNWQTEQGPPGAHNAFSGVRQNTDRPRVLGSKGLHLSTSRGCLAHSPLSGTQKGGDLAPSPSGGTNLDQKSQTGTRPQSTDFI